MSVKRGAGSRALGHGWVGVAVVADGNRCVGAYGAAATGIGSHGGICRASDAGFGCIIHGYREHTVGAPQSFDAVIVTVVFPLLKVAPLPVPLPLPTVAPVKV